MSLFANYRADRLIAEVKSSGNPGSPLAQKALEKLVALGPSAIEPIVDALTTAEKRETLAYVEALSRLDRKSTRLNSSHQIISYAVFCLKKKKQHRVAADADLSGRPIQ